MASVTEVVASIVLVHGAFADGSGWQGVHAALVKEGHRVVIVQNPLTSFAEDVAATTRVLDSLEGPVVLVGHSYGGAVITEAGNHPKVSALVYVAAFAPDQGESVGTLVANPVPDAPAAPILPPEGGYLLVDRAKFAAAFAADVDPAIAAFMADSQVPWNVASLGGVISKAAWRGKPSYYLLATQDLMIPPVAQRAMAARAGAKVVEVAGSHAVFVSKPAEAAALIRRAAKEIPR